MYQQTFELDTYVFHTESDAALIFAPSLMSQETPDYEQYISIALNMDFKQKISKFLIKS
jgi:hypothetical protein